MFACLLKPSRDCVGLILTALLGIGRGMLAGWARRIMDRYGLGAQVSFLASSAQL